MVQTRMGDSFVEPLEILADIKLSMRQESLLWHRRQPRAPQTFVTQPVSPGSDHLHGHSTFWAALSTEYLPSLGLPRRKTQISWTEFGTYYWQGNICLVRRG